MPDSSVNLETDLMGSQLTTLTSADIQRFERDGYVVVRQAFSRADGLAMEKQWWRELEGTHGIRRDDRSSWRRPGTGTGTIPANSTSITPGRCSLSASSARSRHTAAEP